jgi:hypothetical protein
MNEKFLATIVYKNPSGFRMTTSIVAIMDIIGLQHYFLFLTTIVESLTSSNMSSPALSFKSSTTCEGIVINKLLPILRSFSLISISNTYPRDILKYRDILVISHGYHCGGVVKMIHTVHEGLRTE